MRMKCNNCKEKMELLADYSGFCIYWCPECGTIWTGEEKYCSGDTDKFKYPTTISHENKS
jgi:hypothetical protein